MIGRLLLGASLLTAMPSPLLAQPRPAPVWQMDWGNHYCTLLRLPAEGRPLSVAFRTMPGTMSTQIRMTRRDNGVLPRRISQVKLLPSGQAFEVEVHSPRRPSDLLTLGSLPESFWDALAGTSEIQFLDGDEIRASIPVSSGHGAARGFRHCVSDALSSWNIDEAALRALQQRPRPIGDPGVSWENFTDIELDNGRPAQIIMRLSIDAEGRVAGCSAAVTTGNSEIDARTCRLVRRGARFRPALDASGQPTRVDTILAVRWIEG